MMHLIYNNETFEYYKKRRIYNVKGSSVGGVISMVCNLSRMG